jgi:ribosomal protein S18 acetylase RimI-like enzyme
MALVVTPATAADYRFFARLFPELGVPEQPPSSERFAEMIAPHALFVRDGEDVVGYGWGRTRGDVFHVVHVITDPAHRGRGVGRAVMNAFAERARARGLSRWMLNVKPDNTPARALYESCGMRPTFESISVYFRWSDLERLPNCAAVVREPDPSEDATFEAALNTRIGELASFRALGRTIFVAESDGPVGFLAYDPLFPGAAPFVVRDPTVARPLLSAVQPLATHDHLFVFAEGNPALEQTLTVAGGEPRMRVVRMEGEI